MLVIFIDAINVKVVRFYIHFNSGGHVQIGPQFDPRYSQVYSSFGNHLKLRVLCHWILSPVAGKRTWMFRNGLH